MAEVKRYELLLNDLPEQQYVAYSDYAALERRLRIAERAFDYAVDDLALRNKQRGVPHTSDRIKELLLHAATLMIDSEQKEQEG